MADDSVEARVRIDAAVAPGPKEVRRQQRVETSREQILDSAEVLFAERGYHETSLKDVATLSQYSVGSIYSFFQNKDDLYEHVLTRRSILLEDIQDRVSDTLPADQRLVALADVWVAHCLEYPAWGALAADVSRISRSRGGVVPEAWKNHGRRVHGLLVKIITQGQQDGTLREGSPDTLAKLYQAVVTAFVLVTAIGQRAEDTADWSSDTDAFLGFLRDTFATGYPISGRPEPDLPPDRG